MEIPDCYDPIYQAERREAEADRNRAVLPRCDLCRDVIRPGSVYHECIGGTVCHKCFEELSDSAFLQEEYDVD